MVDSGRRSTCSDTAGEDVGHHRGVMLRAAAPVAEHVGVEGHDVAQPHLDLLHREADDADRAGERQEREGRRLTGPGTAGLEDPPTVTR